MLNKLAIKIYNDDQLMSNIHTHFIGIGGIGISALAYRELNEGSDVSGSDSTNSDLIEDLKKEGARIVIGHSILPENTNRVIYTEAINKETNPEYLEAVSRNILTKSYFEALGELTKKNKSILVVGSHGKTTTTAMLGIALIDAELDPTVIVGTKVKEFNKRNVRNGKSSILVVEGCEYRRSFLNLKPYAVVLLNCEWEHPDYYKSEKDYIHAFIELISKIPENGFLVANAQDENVKRITSHFNGTKIWVTNEDAKKMHLKIPGDFNRLNAAHAFITACKIGADESKVYQSLKNFSGTWRRLEIKGELNGATVINDYGHHPTEVRLTLHAIKQKYPNKNIVCVFQPHQYSRTYKMLKKFTESFFDADTVLIPNIYEARDSAEDKSKITAKILAEKIPNAIFSDGLKNTTLKLQKTITANDLVVIMGAGDVSKIAEDITE